MKNNKMLDRAPSVVITSNRNELKVYQDNIIYLNDGDNFELKFFNPMTFKIGVEIIFNSVKKGDSYLILNPGQDVFLDRFLDEQRKMLFETYNIDGNNKEAVEAIEDNGLITFNFYKEYFRSNNNYYNLSSTNPINWSVYNINYSNGNPLTTTNISKFNDTNYCYTQSCNSLGNISFNNSGNVGITSASCNINSTTTSNLSSSNIETGRVEKGVVSNQKFTNVNIEFENLSFYSVSYKIMPYSSKSKSIKDIREYCNSCKYRVRNNKWEYCPKCGNKIY